MNTLAFIQTTNTSAVAEKTVQQPVDNAAYSPYRSTVYAPFSSDSPTERQDAQTTIGAPRKSGSNTQIPDDFGNVADPGYATSPIGEAWVMLLFVAAWTIYKTIKSRKTILKS